MKKILLLLVAMFAFIGNINAQVWNMVVTHNDGTVQVIKASDVKNVTFQLPDQNADQVIIKELQQAYQTIKTPRSSSNLTRVLSSTTMVVRQQ